jgi:ubiquinone/menaquinone biosynthesis C-methylase UbiE
VTALDLSFNMLWEGARQQPDGITWVNGDALALPFEDATFDAVTISFGLRNVPDPQAALAEFARVLRPGGRVVVCEFADPTWAPFRTSTAATSSAPCRGSRSSCPRPRRPTATSPTRSSPGPTAHARRLDA